MPLDLRSNPTPPPAEAPAASAMPLQPGAYHAKMPTPGEFYDLGRMGPRELEALGKLDWPADLPVPDNLREIAQAVVEVNTSYQDRISQLAGSGHVAAPGRAVDFDSLTPEHRRQIVDSVRKFHEDRKAAAAQPAYSAGLSPSVAQAMRDIDSQVRVNVPPPVTPNPPLTSSPSTYPLTSTPTVVPPMQPFTLPPASPAAVPLTSGPVYTPPMQPFTLPPAPAPAPEAAPEAAASTGFCPHCGWDQSRPDDIEPTEDDKLAYLASVLAPHRRFTRVAEFAGGIRVVFRSMTSDEAEACRRQLAQDLQFGRHADEFSGLTALYDYRFVLALESIDMGGRPAWQAMPLSEIQHDPGNATPLPALVAYVLANVLTADGLRRSIQREHNRFVKLCDRLADNLDKPDFFATAARRP